MARTVFKKHVFSLNAPMHPKKVINTMIAPPVVIRVAGSRKKSNASFTTLSLI